MAEVKGMYTCKVCGRDFPLLYEEHYVAMEHNVLFVNKETFFDAIDCPHCGCQAKLQIRSPEYCPCDFGICGECQSEEEDTDE